MPRNGWRSRWSVRARITTAATAVVGAALVFSAVALVLILRASLVHSVSGEAKLRTAELAAQAQQGPLPDPLPAVAAPWPTLVQVVGADGRVLTASAELAGRPPLLDITPGSREQVTELNENLGRGGHTWRVESVPASLGGQQATVIVATAIDQLQRSATMLGALLLIGVPLLLAVVAMVSWFVVGRALHPVEAMRRQVESVRENDLGKRVVEPDVDDEVGRLARTLNAMLARIDDSASQQRQFVDDASHELRSPVANIRTALEVARAHPESANWLAVTDDVLSQDERMQHLIDDLLLLARADSGAGASRTERVDLNEVVAGVLSSPAVDGHRVHFDAGAHAMVVGGREPLARVVTNLVDNASRFATSRVMVSVAATGRWAELLVIDDGPGIPPEERDRVFERFVRLDEHRGRPGGGAGLGLAIVKELVTGLGGTVAIRDGHPGATFAVRLPLAEADGASAGAGSAGGAGGG
jgi:signal transduction histidine kinase